MKQELRTIKKYWGCIPFHYFRYKLYDKDLSKDQLLDYIPPFYFYRYHIPEVFKNVNTSIIEDKILTHNYFIKKGIPTPAEIAYIRKGKIFNHNGEQIVFKKLLSLIELSKSDRIFIKPATGHGGEGILILNRENGKFKLIGEESFERKLTIKFKRSDYIIQEGIKQRSDLNSLNPSSINTLRIVTQIRDKKPHIVIAIIRIGSKNNFVDNSSKGGISVNINLETGKLSKYAYTKKNMQFLERHPDNGIGFADFQISGWSSITEKICEFAEKISEYREIAWDIAIGTDYIYVIELNMNYGLNHLQGCAGGMGKALDLRKNVTNQGE